MSTHSGPPPDSDLESPRRLVDVVLRARQRRVAAANTIYGVTMEERGVSKTVSMRFNHEHGEPEARPSATVADAVRDALPPVPAPVATGA